MEIEHEYFMITAHNVLKATGTGLVSKGDTEIPIPINNFTKNIRDLYKHKEVSGQTKFGTDPTKDQFANLYVVHPGPPVDTIYFPDEMRDTFKKATGDFQEAATMCAQFVFDRIIESKDDYVLVIHNDNIYLILKERNKKNIKEHLFGKKDWGS